MVGGHSSTSIRYCVLAIRQHQVTLAGNGMHRIGASAGAVTGTGTGARYSRGAKTEWEGGEAWLTQLTCWLDCRP